MYDIALAIIPIVLMLAVGVGLKRLRVLRAKDADTVNKIILFGTLPAFVFVAVFEQKIPLRMIQVPFMAVSVTIVVMGLAWFVGKLLRLDRATIGGLILASSFGNTGFLGYPVVSSAFYAGLGTAVIFDNFGMALPLYTVGVSVAAHMGGKKPDWKQLFEFMKLPAFGMVLLALIARWALPGTPPTGSVLDILLKSMKYLMQATVPLAMISLGLSLSWSAVRGSRAIVLAACVLKLLVFPALMILCLRLFPLPQPLRGGTLFESSMPTAMMTGVIAARYRTNGRFVSAAIVISTLLSILTLPVIIYYFG